MGGRVADSDKDCDQSQNDRRNECSERLDRDALPERLTLYPSSEPPGRRLAFHADIVAGGEVNPGSGCTSVGAGRRAAHPPLRRLRHAAATACDQRAWGGHQTAPRPTASSCELPSTSTVRTTRRLARSIRETVPSSELATHTAAGVTATPAAPRPTSIGRRASLRPRCWMFDVGWAIAGARRCGLRR
jgi:hypothetical protein